LILVDKTPMVTYRAAHMERIRRFFPHAKFLHLVRHPVGYGRSLLEFFHRRAPFRHPNQTAALLHNPESIFYGLADESVEPPVLDPQAPWYIRQSDVVAFAGTLPRDQRTLIRGEDLLSDPDTQLRNIARWLGLRSDSAAIEQMKRPERSPFACVGPWKARFGGDPEFLQNPVLRPPGTEGHSLERPVPWRRDGSEFRHEVKSLASKLGYT
jgi:Sulfotransferase family